MKSFIKPLLFITAFILVGFFGAEYASAQQTYFLDATFDPGTGLNNQAFHGVVQPDDKLVLPGNFTTFNGVSTNRIIRINPDGTADTGFQTNIGTGFNNIVYGVTIQPDGKLIAVGTFSQFNGVSRNSLVRLNADGTLDTTFDASASLPGALTFFTSSLQSDGKIVVSGNFNTTIGGTTYTRLIRFNSDGTLDTTFNPVITGGTNTVFSVISPDGKILIVGNFLVVNGVTAQHIARLNSDGTLDTTFNAGGVGFNNATNRAAILPDGKIVVLGLFTTYNGVTANSIIRLNSNGTHDTTFNTGGTGFNPGSSAANPYIQPNGKMIFAGTFTSYNGVSRNSIVRINSDGTLDTSFDTGNQLPAGSANAQIMSQATVSGNTKFYIAGTFTTYDGVSRNRVARIMYVDTTAPVLTPITIASNNTNPSYAKVGDIITLSFSTDDVLTGSTITIGGQTVTPVCNDTGLVTIPCTATLTVTAGIPLVDGVVPFSITAVSAGGTAGPLTTTTNGSSVTVDRLAPSPVTLAHPTNGAMIYTGPQTFTGTCDSTISTVTITGSGFTPVPTTTSCSGGTYSLSVSVINPGSVSVSQIDLAGNIGSVTNTYTLTAGGSGGGSTGYSNTSGGKDTTVSKPTLTASLPITGTGTTYISPVDGTTQQCRPFNTYLKIGKKNDTNEVKLWQSFLNKHMGEKLTVSGIYNKTTESAIKRFQSKYTTEILTPWGLTKPTGYTYQSTRAQGNKILGCSEGPVTLDNGVVIK